MAKRIRKRKGEHEEQTASHANSRPQQTSSGSQTAQWQQGFGNAYLQRMVQRDEESEQSQQRSQEAEPKRRFEYQGHLSAEIDRDKLNIDVKKIIDLHSLGVNRATLPGRIKQWLAALAIALGRDEEPFQAMATISREGILELPLGDELIARITELMGEDPGQIEQINPQLPFGGAGITAEAELCFNSGELESIPLENKEELLGKAAAEPGLFVIMRLRARFPGLGLSDEQDELLGTIILRADF